MRVHNISASSNRKWQLLLAASMLLVAVLVWSGLDGRGARASEQISSTPMMQQVVVVHRDLTPERDVVAEDVRVELRVPGTVPQDAVRDPKLLIGRRPVAHLAVGMPLTAALFQVPLHAAPERPMEPVVVEKLMAKELPPVHEATHGTEPPPPPAAAQVESRARGRGFASYVWVTGGPMAFGVDESGSLHVVDRLGNVMPLDSSRQHTTEGR